MIDALSRSFPDAWPLLAFGVLLLLLSAAVRTKD